MTFGPGLCRRNRGRHLRAPEGKGGPAGVDGATDRCPGAGTRAHLAGTARRLQPAAGLARHRARTTVEAVTRRSGRGARKSAGDAERDQVVVIGPAYSLA